jgi:hypothetical protein
MENTEEPKNEKPKIFVTEDDIKSQLVKLPYQKTRQYVNLINKNIDRFAIIIVRPFKPVKLTVKLHPKHIIQVKAGWIQSIEICEEKDLIEVNGDLYHKQDAKRMKVIENKNEKEV